VAVATCGKLDRLLTVAFDAGRLDALFVAGSFIADRTFRWAGGEAGGLL
jgi:hypothetical protein